MRDFTLGIISGCKTHQAGVPKSRLFHRRLAKTLEEGGRAHLRIRIAHEFDQEHVVRLGSLLEKGPLDAVLVDIRSLFVRKSALITTVVSGVKIRYYLHPFLFRPWRSGWVAEEKSSFAGSRLLWRRKSPIATPEPGSDSRGVDQADIVPGATRVAGISIRDCFYAMGAAVGLDSWALRDEVRMLREVHATCREVGLPLIVLGPSRRPDDFWYDRVCQKLDRRLRRLCDELRAPYVSLPDVHDRAGEWMYRADGLHLNLAGHAYVAEQLARTFEEWLDGQKHGARWGGAPDSGGADR
jgi:hypothetical protein